MASLNKHRASSDGGFYIYDDIELDAAFQQYQSKLLQTLEGAEKRLSENINASMGAPSVVKRFEFELGEPLPRTQHQVSESHNLLIKVVDFQMLRLCDQKGGNYLPGGLSTNQAGRGRFQRPQICKD